MLHCCILLEFSVWIVWAMFAFRILSTWPYHLSRRNLINFKYYSIFPRLSPVLLSLFFSVLLSFTGPYISNSVFLSHDIIISFLHTTWRNSRYSHSAPYGTTAWIIHPFESKINTWIYRSFTTTVSQLKMCYFSGETFNP